MDDVFRFADAWGPLKIVHIYRRAAGLKAVVAIDNIACGPAIGGVRMAPDVSTEEVFRLARAMSLKNAAAGLPHGGGKSVIYGDPRMPRKEKERLIRAFAGAIADLRDYVPGPDMGTDELAMGWIKDEIGRAVGLTREIGGIPLDEIGATGFGLVAAIDVASEMIGLELKGARIVVQGFGAVGKHTARLLVERGAILVAVSDSQGTLIDRNGLDVTAVIDLKTSGRSVCNYPKGRKAERDAVIDIPCDIWIPAARPDVINAGNVGRLRTRLVAQGANIPCTAEAERTLAAAGVLVIPDFIANAGGVICAAIEYQGGTQTMAFAAIDEKIRANTCAVMDEAKQSKTLPRAAGVALAERRICAAMRTRRWDAAGDHGNRRAAEEVFGQLTSRQICLGGSRLRHRQFTSADGQARVALDLAQSTEWPLGLSVIPARRERNGLSSGRRRTGRSGCAGEEYPAYAGSTIAAIICAQGL